MQKEPTEKEDHYRGQVTTELAERTNRERLFSPSVENTLSLYCFGCIGHLNASKHRNRTKQQVTTELAEMANRTRRETKCKVKQKTYQITNKLT